VSEPPVVAVEHLRKEYQAPRTRRSACSAQVAVDDLSFTLAAGGALGIVGESGAGKSTVARMIVGLEQPSAGTIHIAGRERTRAVDAAERKRRAREAQLVYQDPYSSLDPRQRIGDVLDEMVRFHFELDGDARRGRVEQLLDDVGLSTQHAKSLPRALSGGQRQRVAIARALAAEPKVLLLDEAVAPLDVSIQAQVLNLLADIRSRIGVAYIFISHDLGVVRYATEHAIVMRGGTVVEQGPTARLLDNPQADYTRALREAVPHPGWQPRRVLTGVGGAAR
jgi:ABC-type glutathione transport system ATPase component